MKDQNQAVSLGQNQSKPNAKLTYHHWLENVQFEVSVAAPHGHSDVIAHDLGGHHGHRFALRRVHLAFKKTTGDSDQTHAWLQAP